MPYLRHLRQHCQDGSGHGLHIFTSYQGITDAPYCKSYDNAHRDCFLPSVISVETESWDGLHLPKELLLIDTRLWKHDYPRPDLCFYI